MKPLLEMVFAMVREMLKSGATIMPTIAQMTVDIVIVMTILFFTLIPTKAAMLLFSETQRMALPVLVSFMKHSSAATIIMAAIMM